MKSFLATLIVASMALAESLPCNPVPLYRKRAINSTNGMLDRIDTTDINEKHFTFLVDRQIATICSNQVPGTVPLYRGFNQAAGLHMSTLDINEEKFAGYSNAEISGYIYTQPQRGQTGFFNIYRITGQGSNFYTSNVKNEGEGEGQDFFYSMPLEAGKPISFYPKPCNPVRMYRKRAIKPTNGMLDRFDTTNINEAHATYYVDRQIATICSDQAPGTVPLFRGFNSANGFHMSTTEPSESQFDGYKNRVRLIGYVYTELPSGQTDLFKIYRITNVATRTNFFSSDIKNDGEGLGHVYEKDLFYSLPLHATN